MTLPTTRGARALLATTAAYGALEAGSRVIQALAVFLLAYWFRKSEFGEFYTYLAVYQLINVFGTAGLMESLMNRVSRAPHEGAAIAAHVREYLRRAVMSSVALLLAALLYAEISSISLNVVVLCVALVAGALNGFVVLMGAHFTYIGQNRRSILLRSIYALVAYSLALTLAAATHDIMGYFWGQLAAGMAATGVVAWRVRTTLRGVDAGAPRVGSDGSGWFLVPAILNWFFWYGLVVCVSSAFGMSQAADLAFANNIAQGLYIINLAVSQAWMSRYLQHFASSRATAEARTVLVFRLQSLVMLFAAVGVIIAYEMLKAQQVPLLIKYGDIGLPLAILLFAISVSSNYFSAINAYAVNGEGRLLARISIAAYLASIALLVVAAMNLGVFGIYIGLALLIMSRGFASVYFAMRRLHAGFFDARLVSANVVVFAFVLAYYLR